MRRPADDQVAVLEQQRGTLILLAGIEGNETRTAITGGAGHHRRDVGGTPQFLGPRAHIEGMQKLDNDAVDFCLRHHVQRAGGGIDDRRPRDTHFSLDIAAIIKIQTAADRAAPGGYQTGLPVDMPALGIDAVDAVVLRRHIEHVVRRTGDADVGKIQRLRIHAAVNHHGVQLTKLGAVHIRGRERRLLEVRTGSRIVVVIRGDAHLSVQHGGERCHDHHTDANEPTRAESHLRAHGHIPFCQDSSG